MDSLLKPPDSIRKFDNLDENRPLPGKHKLPQWTQYETENLTAL